MTERTTGDLLVGNGFCGFRSAECGALTLTTDRLKWILDAVADAVLIVGPRDIIEHTNRVAEICIPGAGPGENLLDYCAHGQIALAEYLNQCRASESPLSKVLDLTCARSVTTFRCQGLGLGKDLDEASRRLLLLLAPEPSRQSIPENSHGKAPCHNERRLKRPSDPRTTASRQIPHKSPLGEASIDDTSDTRGEVRSRMNQKNDSERLRLARDLHDNAAQGIANLSLHLKKMEKYVSSTDGKNQLDKLRAQIDIVAESLHRVASQLRPSSLNLGLCSALDAMLKEWSEHTDVRTDLFCHLSTTRLPSTVEITLYRLVQEGLTNIIKHAKGVQSVSVVLDYSSGIVRLTMDDDGCGFNTDMALSSHLLANDKLGLAGMQERLALVGGQLHIESELGKGTTIFARIDLSKDAGYD